MFPVHSHCPSVACQAAQEFFSSNEVSYPYYDQQIGTEEVLSGSENAAAANTAAPTSSHPTTSVDSEGEAKELLKKVDFWSENEVDQFPPVVRKRVRRYQDCLSEWIGI